MDLLHSAELDIELTNGNDGRGSRWFRSAKVRKDIEQLLRLQRHERKPFDVPVIVRVTRILGERQRLWDCSSLGRGNWKEIEDALVAIGWFHDDGPKYITEVQWRQRTPDKRTKPRLLIEVFRDSSQGAENDA